MKQLRLLMALLLGALLLAACTGEQAGLSNVDASQTAEPSYTEDWDGRGMESERCDYAGQAGRPSTGWIHWLFSTKGASTGASLALGGTGAGTYEPGPPLEAEAWHVYTPFFELDGLTATISLSGGQPGPGGGLVVSDYCPGVEDEVEQLKVTKDAHTSFKRIHDWDVAKSVDPTSFHLYEDGTGDGTATWTIDVDYLGSEDAEWNVSGDITIENTGDLDAVVTAVEDVLAGDPIDVDCGEVVFPYALAVGATLTCTYDEDGFVEGMNVVTVTTERDEYGDDADIVWGDPTTEVDAMVDVQDVSDLFGTVDLGTVTAPDGDEFTYTKDFSWADYGSEKCDEEFYYENTVSLLDVAGAVLASADATLGVTISCDPPETDVLRVSKTAHTSFGREHHWDLDKSVDESHVKLYADGSGDQTVTWTIDVAYLGATDTAFTIFGEIEIENVSLRTPRTIDSVMDDVGVAGVAPFAVACELEGEPVSLPFDLEPGATLVCAYEVDVTGYAKAGDEGTNTATVMASGEEQPLTATAGWAFDEPTSEKNASVHLWDYSDLVGDWLFLQQFDAPDGGTFTYSNHFAWADYQTTSTGM